MSRSYTSAGPGLRWIGITSRGLTVISFFPIKVRLYAKAALCSSWIALLPDIAAQAAQRDGELLEVLSDRESKGGFASRLFTIRPYSAHVPRTASAFTAWLREILSEGFISGQGLRILAIAYNRRHASGFITCSTSYLCDLMLSLNRPT